MHIALIIALLFSGGTAVAAERALPGDVLYPVKVSVNEEVRSALAFSGEAHAEWDARRAERRLEEAERLADSGRLNAENRADLEARFLAHAEAFQARAERIESEQGVESSFRANSNFEASLRAHEHVLATLADREESDSQEVLSVLGEVRGRLNAVAANRMSMGESIRAEAGANFQNAAQGIRGAAENKISEVKNFLARMEGSVSTSVHADAKAELGLAEGVFARADAEMEAETYGQAFVSYQEAMRLAQKAKIMAAAGQRVDVEANRPNNASSPSQNSNANIEANANINAEVRGPDARSNSERGNVPAGVLPELGL